VVRRLRDLGRFGTWALGVALVCLTWGVAFVSPSGAAVSEPRVSCRVELDRGVLPAVGTQKVVVKVSLDAPRIKDSLRPPVNLAIVLDRSGSMAGVKLEKAKAAAMEALRRLSGRDMFSVVVYDHNVETIVPAQSATNAAWIEDRIRAIQPGGRTALFGGVSQGAAEIRKNMYRKFVHRIILLSDGLANVGPSTPEDLERLGAALIKEDISVTTVGVGTDYNEDLMTRLSQKSDGHAYFVESGADLPRIFSAELGDVLNVVAKKLTVIVEFPKDVRPISIIGREGRIRGQAAELSLNQLYGGQEKYVLLEAEVPAGSSGQNREIATARVTYESPFTQKSETSMGAVSARFSEDESEVQKSANVGVQREYQLNLNVKAQENAIALSDKGRTTDAVDTLRESARRMRDKAVQYGDRELSKKAEETEQQAIRIEQEGMSNKSRKVLRTDSYQLKNQQLSR
jgi:Ca-activated chloride channel homolog